MPNAEFSLPAAMLLLALTAFIDAASRPFQAETLEDRLQALHFSEHPERPIYMQSFLRTYILDIKCYTPESDALWMETKQNSKCVVQHEVALVPLRCRFYERKENCAFMKLTSCVVSVQLAALQCSPLQDLMIDPLDDLQTHGHGPHWAEEEGGQDRLLTYWQAGTSSVWFKQKRTGCINHRTLQHITYS